MRTDMMVHTCKPSYLGGRDGEEQDWRPDQMGKKFSRPPSQQTSGYGDTRLSFQLCMGSINRKINVQADLGIK
jgi:hypothetical protein